MTELDDHISRVEEYGLKRSHFPMQFREHHLVLLKNDAYKTANDRLLFHLTLFCKNCDLEGSVSGRFPDSDDKQISHVCNARVAVFEPFCQQECRNV